MPKKDPSFCACCGAPVTNAGRAGVSGRRYCSEKDCQAAKARADRKYRASFRVEKQAPTSCASCGRTLQARAWRSSDELGRWCHKVACVRARDQARSAAQTFDAAASAKRIALLEETIMFLSEVVMADAEDYMLAGRTVCRVCGLTSAITGWVHPTATGGGCMGTLGSATPRPFDIGLGLAGAWPFTKTWLSPDELAEAYGD